MNRIFIVLGWRNLWRQKRRTALTLSAIALGMACLIFFASLMKGFNQRLIALGTQTMQGEGQIHKKDYHSTRDPEKILTSLSELRQTIRSWPGVQSETPRLYSPALAAMGDRAVSVELLGIDPKTEPSISNWKDRMGAGHYVREPGDIMIGKKLAEKLELEVGGKLVLTVADLKTGELNSQLFRISGILYSQNPQLNQIFAIVSLQDAWKLTGVKNEAHEIAMKFKAPINKVEDIHPVLDSYVDRGLELHDWKELLPEVAFMLKFQDFYMGLTFIIILFLVALGMMNTMGMAIIERIREFGVLQALGTLPGQMVKIVLFEFALMGITGAVLGLIFGWLITVLLQINGIPLNQVEVTGFVLSDPLFPLMDWPMSIMYSVLFCLFVPIFSFVPMQRITKLDTVRALRFS